MRLKSLIKELIPPVLLWLRPRPAMPLYSSFTEALAGIPGYAHSEVIRAVSHKTGVLVEELRQSTGPAIIQDRQILQNLFVLSHVWGGKPLNILDIGGACGTNFFKLDALLPGKLGRWRVVETAAMADAGNQVFARERLEFYEHREEAVHDFPDVDLIIASGVLPYIPSPLEALDAWLNAGARWLYLTRNILGVNLDRPLVTRQETNLADHMPGALPPDLTDKKIYLPMTIMPWEHLAARWQDRGWRAAFTFHESEERVKRVGSETVRVRIMGFLLRKVG